MLANSPYERQLVPRTLSLNCLTTHYAELWQSQFDPAFCSERWTSNDPRLNPAFFSALTHHWQRNVALRSDYERRQALLEIDVLVAMALGLTLDELETIYRIQFPVMQQYERDTFYDTSGRIVWTNSKGLVGVGLESRKEWEAVQDLPPGQSCSKTFLDDTLPGGAVERTITYTAPFLPADRVSDYRTAWKGFSERFTQGEGA